ncbi:CHAP domain-containing protein [Eubacterium coprostanoligenes]|uniref:CHAP domain-containing protein n=1 Tax=Eubacterium coprostanoligenes TaxID=290054 RepID=UPI00235756E1|nr:CHAP domain-containing protein [Eubacterium coprostanoligenes]MCI6354925.1 CHAP domain-containing protein [Eubacterium coprostanoligenes]
MKKIIKAISFLLVAVMMCTALPMNATAASVGEMQNEVLDVANGEVGYTGTSKYCKYGEWLGYQGGWCTTFVLWCFNKAGEKLGVSMYKSIVPSGGNCNSMISWYKNRDRYHTRESGYTPKKGDLIFFDWSGNGSSQHVGLVDYIEGSTVYTVEGNCSGKVKARKYTTSGSKPYNNVSAIMGYGVPDYSSVAKGGSSKPTTTKRATTTKKHKTTKKVTTTKKITTTKKVTATKKVTSEKTTTAKAKTTKPSAQKVTTTQATTAPTTAKQEISTKKKNEKTKNVPAQDMELYASTTDLEVGDSVKLGYTLEPLNSTAVIGYFCDEEGIIQIENGGEIKAIGEGTATVVVCANDEIYRQCDFTVSSTSTDVTKQKTANDYVEELTTSTHNIEKTKEQKLNEIGINVQRLKNNDEYYYIPLAICGATVVMGLLAFVIRKAVKKKEDKENKK